MSNAAYTASLPRPTSAFASASASRTLAVVVALLGLSVLAPRAKAQPGTHAMGRAADILADGRLQYRIIALAPGLGFLGIGIAKTFIHLDDWDGGPRPNVWLY